MCNLLVCPHSNAIIERYFSFLYHILSNKYRNKLEIDTINALMILKTHHLLDDYENYEFSEEFALRKDFYEIEN